MSKEKKSTGTALGEAVREFCYFLTTLFCALRACDVITWPWYWVMSPVFFSWIIAFATLILIGVLTVKIINDKD